MIEAFINIAAQIEEDAGQPTAALAKRDRAHEPQLAKLKATPTRQLMLWIQLIRKEQAANLGHQVVSALWAISSLLALLGLLLGFAVASGVFYYDGNHPVNVTRFLWLFVLLPMVFLLLFAVIFLPRSLTQKIPPIRAWRLLVTQINFGILWRTLARLLPHDSRAALERGLGRSQSHGLIHGRIYRWQLLRWSQVFALSFQIGVVLMFILLISLEDRAFGWSTTLQMTGEDYHQLTHMLATPWAGLFEQAVPDLSMVEATRYYRSSDQPLDSEQAARWWPFVLACLCFYGLLPRLLTWAYCCYAYRKAARQAIAHLPGSQEVLDRINHPQILTAATEPAHASQTTPVEKQPAALPREPQILIAWAQPPVADQTLPFEWSKQLEAGGIQSIEQDQAVLEQVIQALNEQQATGVVLTVRGWEPPMLELFDWLKQLRQGIGPGVRVTLIPMSTPTHSANLKHWQDKVQTLADPWLVVAQAPREVTP